MKTSPPTALPLRLAAALLLVAAGSGCDLLGPDGRLYAGVVVERDTDIPIEGIHVSFQYNSGFGFYSIVAETRTDREGRFRLRSPGRYHHALFVNSLPYGVDPNLYNPAYSGGNFTTGSDRMRIRIELVRRDTPPEQP